jgi:hypothetical protein
MSKRVAMKQLHLLPENLAAVVPQVIMLLFDNAMTAPITS